MATASLFLMTPIPAGTVNVAATTSTGNVQINANGATIRVKNIDVNNVAFINFGDSTVTAAVATGIPIGPGDIAGFTRAAGWTHAAAITGTGTATVYFTAGDGS